jgi:hypothetical protein
VKVIEFGRKMAQASPGKLTLVKNEEDDSPVAQPEAAHFLKLNGKRVGRDLELYEFIGKIDPLLLPSELLELCMTIDRDADAHASVDAVKQELLDFGLSVYTGKMAEAWRDLVESTI